MEGISILDGERNSLSLKSNLVSRSFAVLMCILVFAASAFSQTGTSGITGVISDQQGRSIGGAKITLTNLGTNATRTTVSTDAGVYIFDLLPPADYRLRRDEGRNHSVRLRRSCSLFWRYGYGY